MTHWMSSVFVAFNDLQKVVVFFRELRPHHHEHRTVHSHICTWGLACPLTDRVPVLDILENGGWLAENNSFHVCMQSTCPQKQQHQQPATSYHWECGTVCLCTTIHGSCGSGSHQSMHTISPRIKIIFRRESSNWTHEEKETFLRSDLP